MRENKNRASHNNNIRINVDVVSVSKAKEVTDVKSHERYHYLVALAVLCRADRRVVQTQVDAGTLSSQEEKRWSTQAWLSQRLEERDPFSRTSNTHTNECADDNTAHFTANELPNFGPPCIGYYYHCLRTHIRDMRE